ncbi:yippee-domain-containing protein [Rhodotorula sp. JG-1b]|nr:yippee-domain-containing protein [Rhodotorula sp. JG-1b]
MTSPRSSLPAATPTPLPLPPAHVPLFRCQQCTLPLALTDSLVSRAFQGSSGPAILVRNACNVKEGERENKVLMSGRHVIATIRCTGCDTELGWRYFVSPDSSQKYKEGKYILEKVRASSDNAWFADDAP